MDKDHFISFRQTQDWESISQPGNCDDTVKRIAKVEVPLLLRNHETKKRG